MQKFLAFLFIAFFISADLPSYKIFSKGGKSSDFDELVTKAQKADVVLFGELHNNAIAHWLQLELTKKLFDAKKENLVLGAEMFEADGQLLLNEYLAGEISESNF